MNNRLFYPAIFHKSEEGGFWISFPDFPECFSQGETMEDAYEMAVDALGLCLCDMEHTNTTLPKATPPSAITLSTDSLLLVIEFNMADYKRKHNSKAVKKTLSIPEWLNEEALALDINFSQVLKEALVQKIAALKA